MKPLARHARASVIGFFSQADFPQAGSSLGWLLICPESGQGNFFDFHVGPFWDQSGSGFMRTPKIVPDCKPSTFLNATY